MFIPTAQNTCSRDNTVTANKTYSHTDWNASGFKGITVLLPQGLLGFCQVLGDSKSQKKHVKKCTLKKNMGYG